MLLVCFLFFCLFVVFFTQKGTLNLAYCNCNMHGVKRHVLHRHADYLAVTGIYVIVLELFDIYGQEKHIKVVQQTLYYYCYFIVYVFSSFRTLAQWIRWCSSLSLANSLPRILSDWWSAAQSLTEKVGWSADNMLRLRQYGHHFADDIFKLISVYENSFYFDSPKFVLKGPIDTLRQRNMAAIFQMKFSNTFF